MTDRERTTGSRYQPTYLEQPSRFDTITFRNQEVERVVRGEFEHRLTHAVRQTEALVIDQAGDLKDEINAVRKAAEAMRKELRDMQLALRDDERVDLERWSVLDANTSAIASDSQAYGPRVEAMVTRLESPMEYASELQNRFPAMHRPNLVEEVVGEHLS